MATRTKTPQGIEVTIQGKAYRPYCNQCPWTGPIRETMARAQALAKAHNCKEHQ